MAMHPPRPHPQRVVTPGQPAGGLVCRPGRGLASWLTEDGPCTAPSSRQSLPVPSVGSGKINKQPWAAGSSPASPSPDGQGQTERDPRRAASENKLQPVCRELTRRPLATGEPADRWRLCLMGQSGEQKPRQSRQAPARRRGEPGGRRPVPSHPATPQLPALWRLGPRRGGSRAYLAPGGCDRRQVSGHPCSGPPAGQK